jgi:rhodanese-related sulfurtransferase
MRYLTFALTLFVALFACSRAKQPVQARQPEIRRLPPEEFARLLADTSTVLVSAEPAPKGEIPGTRFTLPADKAVESLKVVQPDMTLPIAVYCELGQKSDSLAVLLGKAGYRNICTLRGGSRAWVEKGLPFRLYDQKK